MKPSIDDCSRLVGWLAYGLLALMLLGPLVEWLLPNSVGAFMGLCLVVAGLWLLRRPQALLGLLAGLWLGS